jgi:hypothetical protein
VADLDKAALRNRVLEHLSVIAAGEAPAAADRTLVEEAIDAAFDRLSKERLIRFPATATPPWAQIQMRDIVAADVAAVFGMTGQRLAEFKQAAAVGRLELARQVAGYKHDVPIRGAYF